MKILLLLFTAILLQNIVIAQTTFTVMTYNIFHGANTDNNYDLDRIANVIKSKNPDVVALQEVDYRTVRTNRIDLAKELAERTNMFSVFGKAMDFDDGQYGVAVLSKKEIINSRNHLLPHLEENEPRTALEVLTTLASGDTISFISTHLDYQQDYEERLLQVNKINEVFSNNKHLTILSGDFNDHPKSKPINVLQKNWETTYKTSKLLKTFPSNNPNRKIDYILFQKQSNLKVVENGTICDSIASDHCAYWVKFIIEK